MNPMIPKIDAFNLITSRIRFYEKSWNGPTLTYGYCYAVSDGMFHPFTLGRLSDDQRENLCITDEGMALVARHDAVVKYIEDNGKDADSVFALIVPKEALTYTSRIDARLEPH